jgi:RNA polymerase primary sigma factor
MERPDSNARAGATRPVDSSDEFEFGAEQSAAIESEARRRLPLDRSLASDLGRGQPPARVEPVTSGYLEGLDRRPQLSEARERELVIAAQAGDRTATAQLIEEFLPAIGSVAALYRHSAQVDRVELLQEGVVGFLRALERFDPARGVRFWSYAAWWVRQAMQHLVSELTMPVVLSDRALRHLSRVREAHTAFVQDHDRQPSSSELADAAGLSPEQVTSLVATGQPARPLDATPNQDDRSVGPFGDLLVDPLAEDEYQLVLDRIEIDQLRNLLSGLSDRERMVLSSRYGLHGQEQSLRQVAGRLGLSAERVRQIEQRALGKLRSTLEPPDARRYPHRTSRTSHPHDSHRAER